MARSLRDLPPVAQIALLAILAVVVVGAPSYFYVFPLFEQRTKLEKQVADLQAENKKNQAVEQRLTEYRNQSAQLESQLENLRAFVPDDQATDEFMKMVFAAANEASVHVRTFIAQPTVPKEYYVEMPFKIRVDGTYWGLVNYFDRLAHEPRIVSVGSIELGQPGGGGMGAFEISPSESVGANCILTTYFNRAQQAAGAAPAKK
jgi:type IV pilus assembly protein PilO